MTAALDRRFASTPGLLVRLNCRSFAPARRNPDGALALSPDQERALDTLFTLLTKRDASKKRTVLLLAGYAGTGKTTVMRALLERLEAAGQEVALLAPTGKAAARLRDATGRETQTVHSFIYGEPTQVGTCPYCKTASADLGKSRAALRREGLDRWTCPSCGRSVGVYDSDLIERRLGFAQKTGKKAERIGEPRLAVAITDEASMIGTTLARDIEAFLEPQYAVLYVGDKGQLPPVGEAWGPDFDHPTAELSTVHRQAAGNPIVNLATRIREGKNRADPFKLDVPGGDRVRVLRASMQQAAKWLADARDARADATLITYTNKRRQQLNEAVRHLRGLDVEGRKQGVVLVRADRALLRSNNKAQGLANGEVLIVEKGWLPGGKLRDEKFQWIQFYKRAEPMLVRMDLVGPGPRGEIIKYPEWADEMKPYVSDVRRVERKLDSIARGYDEDLSEEDQDLADAISEMNAEELFDTFGAIRPSLLVHVDFGECVTVHTSQGSAWKNVGLVYDYATDQLFRKGSEKDPQEGVRFLYTAVTRASERLVVFNVT